MRKLKIALIIVTVPVSLYVLFVCHAPGPERENQELATRWMEEIWNDATPEKADVLLSDDFTFNWAPPGTKADRVGYRKTLVSDFQAFSGNEYRIEEMFAEEDLVVVRWSSRSVHSGDYAGIAATNKMVTLTGISILRIENGLITEETTEMDIQGLMAQLNGES